MKNVRSSNRLNIDVNSLYPMFETCFVRMKESIKKKEYNPV